MNEVRRFTRTREEIDRHGHPYEVEELCVLASDYDALAARVQAVEVEIGEIQGLLRCHRAYIQEAIRDLQARTEEIPNIDRVRQAEQQLADMTRARDEALAIKNAQLYDAQATMAKQAAELQAIRDTVGDTEFALRQQVARLRACLTEIACGNEPWEREAMIDAATEALRETGADKEAIAQQIFTAVNTFDQAREALQALYDEQNDAPLENRRVQWKHAMGLAHQALAAMEAQP